MFSTDDYWEGNNYDCPDDLPDYLRDDYLQKRVGKPNPFKVGKKASKST